MEYHYRWFGTGYFCIRPENRSHFTGECGYCQAGDPNGSSLGASPECRLGDLWHFRFGSSKPVEGDEMGILMSSSVTGVLR